MPCTGSRPHLNVFVFARLQVVWDIVRAECEAEVAHLPVAHICPNTPASLCGGWIVAVGELETGRKGSVAMGRGWGDSSGVPPSLRGAGGLPSQRSQT